MIGNLLDQVELIERRQTGVDKLGNPVYENVTLATTGARVRLIDVLYAQQTAQAFTDVSVRIPYGVPDLITGSKIRVLNGPLAGIYAIRTVRRNREHVHYVVRTATL